MNRSVHSLILVAACRFLMPLLLLYSFFLLLRGHHEPGGGFVGGLMAASCFLLHLIAHEVQETRKLLKIDPVTLLAVGVLVAAASGIVPLLFGEPLLTGVWGAVKLPIIGELGTPLLFDIGVYLAVMGVTLSIIFSLAEE